MTVKARGVIVEHHHKYFTESDSTEAIVRNVISDCDVINVFITATNQHELVGERCSLKQPLLHTLLSCRYTLLQKEIELAMKTEGKYIETSFLNGIPQKLQKVDYIKKLRQELEVTEEDPMEIEETQYCIH